MPGFHRLLDSSPPKTKAVSQGGGTSPMWETEQTDTPNSILAVSGETDLMVKRTGDFTEKHRDISGTLAVPDPKPDWRWSPNTVLKTSEVNSDVVTGKLVYCPTDLRRSLLCFPSLSSLCISVCRLSTGVRSERTRMGVEGGFEEIITRNFPESMNDVDA